MEEVLLGKRYQWNDHCIAIDIDTIRRIIFENSYHTLAITVVDSQVLIMQLCLVLRMGFHKVLALLIQEQSVRILCCYSIVIILQVAN